LNHRHHHTISIDVSRLITAFILLALIFSGCNPTRYVPDDAYLLNKNKIETDNGNISRKELESTIRQKPNKRILGARFHLFLYNLSNIKKQNWPHGWLRSIGEEPVILDKNLLQRSTGQLKSYLKNKGYYQSVVKDTIEAKKKKAEVIYRIHTGRPYVLRQIKYNIHDTALIRFVIPDTINSVVHAGNLFDADVLIKERSRIETLLKNKGFYNFTSEYVVLNADTTLPGYKVDLEIEIKNFNLVTPDNIYKEVPHPRYRIKDIYVYTEFDPLKNNTSKVAEDVIYQTAQFDSIHFIYSGKPYIKPKIINQSIYVQKSKYFNLDDVDKTYLHLTSLHTYKTPGIQFEDPNGGKYEVGEVRSLDCRIRLQPLSKQSYSVNLEGSYSNGLLGVEGSVGYTHKNLFRGAEILDLSVKGGVMGGKVEFLKQIRSILDFSATSNIRIPAFWLPFRTEQFIKKFSPKTNISISYQFQRLPYYTGTIASTSFGYIWQGNQYLTHIVNPIELNAVKIYSIDTAGLSINENPYAKNSYQNHFVSVSNYTFIWNNQKVSKVLDYSYYKVKLESGGNILGGLSSIFSRPKVNGSYEIFGLQYSQFIRGDLEAKYYKIINSTDKVVFRFFGGAGFPYGNSKAMPFEKQYFSGGFNSIRAWVPRSLGPSGGFNSIRAWVPRSLGPGSFDTIQNTKFPYNPGDIKLETNVEYRFKLFWILEGALFADAGNIWAISKKDTRQGALFEWNKFANDIALGVGFGLRFDFQFFIFSADLGYKARDPAAQGNKWLPYGVFTNKALALNVGIGYPF
jgi:outer membrane protein assembly factor BamA